MQSPQLLHNPSLLLHLFHPISTEGLIQNLDDRLSHRQ